MKIDLPAEVNAEIQTNLKAQNAAEIQAEIDSQRQVNFKSSMTVAAGFEPARYAEAVQLERASGVPAKVAYDNWDKVQQVKQEDKLTGLFTTTPRTADALSNPQHAIIAKGDEENLQYMERAVERATFDQQGFFDRQIAGPFQKWWNRDTIGEAPGRLRQLDRITTDFDRVDAGDDFSSPWANEYRAADEAGRKVMRDNLQLEQNLSIEKTRGAQFEIGQMPVDPGDVAFDKAQGVAGVASTIANDPLWAARKAGESLPDMAQGLALGLINPIFGSVSEGTTAANYKLIEVLQEKGIDPSDPIQLMKALRDDDLMNEANARAARYGAGIGAVSLLSFGLLGKVMAPTAIGGKALSTGQRELISAGVQMPVQGALEAAGEATGQLAERGRTSDLDSKEIALEGFLATLMAVPEAGGFAGKRFMQHMAQARRTERAATLQTDLVGKSLESSTRKNDPATFDAIVGAQLAGKPNEWLEIPAAKLQELNQSGQVNVPELLEQINVDPNHYAAQVELGGTVRMKNSSYLAYLAEYDEQLSSSVRFSTNDMSLEEVQAIDKQMLADMEQVAQNFGKTDQVAAAYSDVMGQLLGAGYERSAADTTARQYAAVMTRLAEQTGQTVEEVMAANPLNIGRDLPPAVRRIKGDEISLMLGRLRAGDVPRPADMFGKSLTEYLTAAGGLDDTGGELAAFDADVGKVGRNRLARAGGKSMDDAAMAAWERGYFPGMAREDVTPNMLIDALREEAAGTPRFSVEQENATLRDQAANLEALQDHLDSLGVDLEQMTDEEVLALLRGQEGQAGDQMLNQQDLTPDQQRLVSMTEDEYIAAVNPENKRSDSGDIVIVREGDLFLPSGSELIEQTQDRTGQPVEVYADKEGSLYAVQNDEVVGQIENRDNETLNIVTVEAQGKGIGTALAAALIHRDPFAQAGSFSPAGEAARRSAFRKVKAELLVTQMLSQSQTSQRERKPETIYIDSMTGDGTTKVLKNPTRNQALAFAKAAKYESLRGIVDPVTGDLYIADSHTVDHKMLAEGAGLAWEDIRYSTDPDTGSSNRLSIPAKAIEFYPRNIFSDDVRQTLNQSARFSEDNRLSNLSMTGPSWERIRAANPSLAKVKSGDDMVTIYRATIGDQIRPDDFVAVNRKVAAMELESVRERDGAGEIIEQRVPVRDLLMANDATEFVYFPEQRTTLNQSAAGQTARELSVELEAAYPSLKLDLLGSGDRITLSRIVLPKEGRGQGTGTAIMQRITAWADQNGKTIGLTPSGDFGGSKSRLPGFYKRFGFIENKGKNRDFEISEAMYRPAQQSLAQAGEEDARGTITFGPRHGGVRRFDIKLGKKSDLSTVLHEMGHYYLEVIGDLVQDGKANEALAADYGVIRDWLGADPVGTSTKTKPVASGMVRLYHGGTEGSEKTGGQRYLTPDKAYAQGYADKATNGRLYYVDVPADSPLLVKAFDDSGTGQTAPFVAFNAPDELSAQLLQFNENDMAAIGATPLTVDQHEQFARGFEKYLATGKAPSIELQDAFARFKRWLVGVYKDLARLNVEISPEVRGVFDRLLASEQAITEAEQALALTEQYEARITELMSEDEKANYLRASRQARDDATSEIEQEILKAEQQKEQRWYKEQRRKVEAEVRSELEASQAYQARKYLFGNTPHPETGRPLRLDTAAVTELFGTKSKEARFLGRARARENGVHPEIAASILGYPNPVEMLTDMRAVPSLAEAVKLETERRMAERYPDPRKDGTLADKAMAAVGEREAEVQAIQLRTLARQAGRAPSQHKIIKEAARRHISSLKLRDVIPHAFRRASEKAARAVEDALIKGDMPKAYEEKEKQLMNLHLFREAVKAQDLSIQKRAQAKTYTKAGAKRKRLQDASVENYELAYPDGRIEYAATKTAAKQAEADGAAVTPLFNFLEQVDAILTRYEFSIPRRAIRQQREALVEFLASMSGEHIVVNPPEWILLDRSQRTNWSELTIDELVDAVDMIKQIDQMAKNKLQVLKAGRWEEFEPIRDAIVNSIELNASSARSSQFNKSFADDIRRWGREWLGLLPVDQIARELDGQDELGPVQENITTPVQVAARKAVIREKAEHQALAELIKQFYSDDQIKGMAEKRIAVAEINDSLTKMQMIMLMANLGNEGNRKALLSEQRGIWSAETIQSVMSRLDSNDADFVEALWSWVDKFWPEVSENEARRTGVTPAKVENDPYPVKLADGKVRVLKGGYFPLKYDGDMSIKTSQDDVANAFKNMTAGRTAKAYTPEGHRIERVGSGGRPVKLDLSVVLGHVNEVVRDIVMTDPVNQSWRYLHDGEIQGAFERSNLKEIFTALEIWLQDTAEGEKVDSGYMTASARWLRTGFTANVMLFNLANSALNLAGTHPLVVLGKRWALNGYRNAMKPANWQQMYELSEYMREARVDSYSKDLQLVQDHMRNKGGWRDVMTQAGFYLHNKTQMFMDAVTWMGAYEKGMSMDLVGQDLITYADQRVVEASGSGVFADRSAMERGTITRQTRQNELVRGLTTLAGYMIRKMAIARRRTAETDFKDVAQAVNWAVDMALLFTVEGLMFALVKGNVPDEEDEDQAAGWAKAAGWETFAGALSGLPPYGRPLVSAIQGFGGGSSSIDIFAEQFGNALTQAKQGDADVTAAKALIAMVGTATKTPGIATNRVIDWLDRAQDGETPPWYELLTGNRDK